MFGVAIATAIFAAEGSYRTTSEFVDGLSPAFITLGVLCAIGVLARSSPAAASTSSPGQHPWRLALNEHMFGDHAKRRLYQRSWVRWPGWDGGRLSPDADHADHHDVKEFWL